MSEAIDTDVFRHAIGLAWAAVHIEDYQPLLTFSKGLDQHLSDSDKSNWKNTEKNVGVQMLGECCRRAAGAASYDQNAQMALINIATSLQNKWPLPEKPTYFTPSICIEVMTMAMSFLCYERADNKTVSLLLDVAPDLAYCNISVSSAVGTTLLPGIIRCDDDDLLQSLLERHAKTLFSAADLKPAEGFMKLLQQSVTDGTYISVVELLAFSVKPAALAIGIEPVKDLQRSQLLWQSENEEIFMALLGDDFSRTATWRENEVLKHAYSVALSCKFHGAARMLREQGYSCNAVFDAIYSENSSMEALDESLKAPEADINTVRDDINGASPLTMTAMRWRIDLFAKLLSEGADPGHTIKSGETAYQCAKKEVREDFQALLDAHAAREKMLTISASTMSAKN